MHIYMKERWSCLLFLHPLCVFVIIGGGEKDIDNEECKYKIDGKKYLTLHGMKRINQDMGLCTRWGYVIMHIAIQCGW